MSKKRRQHSADLKAKVGLEALEKEAAERLPEVFARKGSHDHDAEASKEREKVFLTCYAAHR